MRISNKQIKKIIQEEIRNVLNEADPGCGPDREGKSCMAKGTDPRAFGGGVVPGVCKQGKCVDDVDAAMASPEEKCKKRGGKYNAYTKECAYEGTPAGQERLHRAQATTPPPKKKIKYSTAVKEMQMAMIFDPEIGKKLRKIMGKADGRLGPRTQKAVNYLRRHYKQKGEEVPRGVANVAKFLEDKDRDPATRPRKHARVSDVSEYPVEAQGRKGGPVAEGGRCKWRRASVKAGTRGWSEVCGEGLICIGYKAEPVSRFRWKGKCTVPTG